MNKQKVVQLKCLFGFHDFTIYDATSLVIICSRCNSAAICNCVDCIQDVKNGKKAARYRVTYNEHGRMLHLLDYGESF